VFAGGEAEAGTAEAPAEFSWTVPADAPAELYYQCAVHQKLGWKLLVGDAAAPAGDVAAPAGAGGEAAASGVRAAAASAAAAAALAALVCA
jgi:hypothetical protein